MPNLTPKRIRQQYQLYSGKPCTDEGRRDCLVCLRGRVESTGRSVGFNRWGDSRHFSVKKRRG